MSHLVPHLRRLLLMVPMAIPFLAGGCAVSQQQEVQMGQDARSQFEREFGGPYPDSEVQRYVNDVGMRMARQAGRADLPWEFRVLNSAKVNAFALPGGFIYISKGLLFNLSDEAELAGILGHEAAHIAHRDSVQQLQRAQVLQGGAMLAGLLGGSSTVADVSQLVAGLIQMQYSRDQEQAADMAGLRYMVRGGYDPRGMVEAMSVIKRLSGGGGPPEFLSSHPSTANREEYLMDAIRRDYAMAAGAGRIGREEFAQAILRKGDAEGLRQRNVAPRTGSGGEAAGNDRISHGP